MKKQCFTVLLGISTLVGCQGMNHINPISQTEHPSVAIANASFDGDLNQEDSYARAAVFHQDNDSDRDESYDSMTSSSRGSKHVASSIEKDAKLVAGPDAQTGMTLEQIEELAIQSNPAIAQIEFEIEALHGKLVQAGLEPNPTVGINGEDINDGGGSGRYGVYFGRQIVRGNKLALSQSVVDAELTSAEQRLTVMKQRLLTDVRQRYFEVVVSKKRIEIADELLGISKSAVENSEKLFAADEVAKTAVLQSELEFQNASVVKRQAENTNVAAKRKLAALVGDSQLDIELLDIELKDISALSEFESSYDELVESSPELAVLFANVEQAKRQLNREVAEPIPNVTWQTTIQLDTVGDNVIGGFQVGMPLPILNQNQGAIHQARQQVWESERKAEKKILDLRQRLAAAFEAHKDAKIQVDVYDSQIIPKSKETLELILSAYQNGESDFLQLLTAQRSYSQFRLAYLEKLQQLLSQRAAIQGMLLTGSLD